MPLRAPLQRALSLRPPFRQLFRLRGQEAAQARLYPASVFPPSSSGRATPGPVTVPFTTTDGRKRRPFAALSC
eukprot:11212162-Lingulodinium_polyedra.AAC.1